jgi:hypothetical protein
MRTIGFSTGALALGDFRRGLALLATRAVRAVELSALRESELPFLMAAMDELDLSAFEYVSIHAPGKRSALRESEVAQLLTPCIARKWPVVVHPDSIVDHGYWRDFGSLLCLENMDNRKRSGRTAEELAPHFQQLPDASFCLDLGHAQQVDPTLSVARKMLRDYGHRLKQLHLSELNNDSHHQPLSMATVWAVREIARLIPDCPVILESVIASEKLDDELEMAAACFEKSTAAFARVARAPLRA